MTSTFGATTAKMSLKLLRGTSIGVVTDGSGKTRKKLDPFCEVYVDGTKIGRTSVKFQTTNPVWCGPTATYEFCLPRGEGEDAEVRIEVRNFGNLGGDSPIGSVTFHTSHLLRGVSNGHPNVWLPVVPAEKRRNARHGSLQIRLQRFFKENKNEKENEIGLALALSRESTSSTSPSVTKRLSAGPKLGMMLRKKTLRKLYYSSRAPVTLHVYDVSHDKRIRRVNDVTKATWAGGIFHAAIEIYGREYSFGFSNRQLSGIFAGKPRRCPMHRYRELVECSKILSEFGEVCSHKLLVGTRGKRFFLLSSLAC